MTEKIEIPLSKNKLFLGIGGSIILVVLGIWLVINADEFQEHSMQLLRNPMVIKAAGTLAILFFGATGIYGCRKLLDKKVGLIIDSNGITDNSNASSVGLIEWNDISEIKTQQVMSTKFLLINVIDSEKHIGKAKSGLKARLMRTNMKMYGTPLSITSNTLKYDFEKLEQLIQAEFNRNKNLG
ncbi:hypothetical protein Celal_3256 [Cellulophaga algicola DSM 14237]|uniref:Uncharacterized protein n=1 Tax=Cellulophaga algicola (strain DSM 14237 / IC166 / ACAM 630) TaxID=688270 RepID=E6X5H0_CELAD|nr:STM3941 family protein [Cellulophaga algicola]ADV50525.1 hypothetical protein Celal_3256 [Cellulophaga algicola DSM 14237]